jgi:hypothetical protein
MLAGHPFTSYFTFTELINYIGFMVYKLPDEYEILWYWLAHSSVQLFLKMNANFISKLKEVK